MPHYIGLIHKEPQSCYGLSFPDLPGVFTAGDSIDETMQRAAEVLEFAAEDWENPDGSKELPLARSMDKLRSDPQFQQDASDAVVVAVPFRVKAQAAE